MALKPGRREGPRKAVVLAAAAGVTLGALTSLNESRITTMPPS